MKPRFAFLFSAATPDLVDGGHGTPAAAVENTPAAETPAPAPAAAAPAQASTPAPGPIERITSYLAGKAELIKERDEAKQSLQAITIERDNLAQELATAKQQLADAQSQLQRISDALTAAEQKAQSVNQAAAAQVAEAGLPSAALPAQEDAQFATIEQLEKAYQSATDPKEKHKIAMEIKKLHRENAK